MAKQQVSYSLAAEGSILSCPSRVVLGSQNGKAVCYGRVHWGGKSLSDAVAEGLLSLIHI